MFVRSSTPVSTRSAVTHRGLLALVAMITAAVLVLTANDQIYDTNFYSLWEATALRLGDHPYRDFFEWGIPLQAVVSAIAQIVSGHRLLGEFIVQWLFIIAGVLIAFDLGLRVTQSRPALCVLFAVALLVLATTPTFHYTKLFFYPLAIALGWRYIDRPAPIRAAVLGLATAVAFLFRHDHGVYLGGASVLACAIARVVHPAVRTRQSIAREALAYAAVAAIVVAPWAVVVQTGEGLPDYIRARAYLYTELSARGSPYQRLRRFNPVPIMFGERPVATPGLVAFDWNSDVDEARRRQLEGVHGLQRVDSAASDGRSHYRIVNIYDRSLLELNHDIHNSDGIPWDQLQALDSRLPSRDTAQLWLMQISLLVPILVLAAAGLDVVRNRLRRQPVSVDTWRIVFAAVFLAVIESRLFRETSYFVTVAPVTAALAVRLLPLPWHTTPRALVHGLVATTLLIVTSVAAFAFARDTNIQHPMLLAGHVPEAFTQLLASPAIDGYAPRDEALQFDPAAWSGSDIDDRFRILMRYLHDCTPPGDRILVTGSTPFQVGYYTELAIAGGHVFWRTGWRSDPPHQMQSLALLQHQSVPFAFSTDDPVLEDLGRYPAIRDYLVQHYVALAGSDGRLLLDRRRQPTGKFGALGFPCFR